MNHLDDRLRPARSADRTTSRRALVRGAAWAVPVVSIATAAPAHAAISAGPTSLVLQSASYWVKEWPDGTYGVVPMITVRNPTPKLTGQVMMQLRFPTSEFIGTRPQSDPPSPEFVNIPPLPSSDGGWVADLVGPVPGDTSVTIRLIHGADLGRGDHTVGNVTASDNPSTFVWKNLPAANATVTVILSATGIGFTPVSGVMARVDPPA